MPHMCTCLHAHSFYDTPTSWPTTAYSVTLASLSWLRCVSSVCVECVWVENKSVRGGCGCMYAYIWRDRSPLHILYLAHTWMHAHTHRRTDAPFWKRGLRRRRRRERRRGRGYQELDVLLQMRDSLCAANVSAHVESQLARARGVLCMCRTLSMGKPPDFK